MGATPRDIYSVVSTAVNAASARCLAAKYALIDNHIITDNSQDSGWIDSF